MMVNIAAFKTLLTTFWHPRIKSFPRDADVLLVRHDIDCGYTYRGLAYAHILDSVFDILESMGKTCCTVASPYSSLIGDKAYGNPVCINRQYAWATLTAKIKPGSDSVRKNVRAKKDVWKRVIDAVSPKVIFSIAPGPELCWAANESGIPAYDIQHGVINDGHVIYKEVLRDGPREYVPRGFLCWDQTAAKTLDWASACDREVYVVGNPWFSRFIERKGVDPLVEEALSKKMLCGTGKKTVLVTLQWGLREFFSDPDYYEILPKFLIDAIKQSGERYNWWLRLHPVQVRSGEREKVISFLEKEFGKNGAVRWEEPTSYPLPQLLARCDLHITDCGSTTIEAAWFGIPTALLNDRYENGGVLEQYFVLERSVGLANCVRQEPFYILDWIDRNGKSNNINTWVGGDLRPTLASIVPEMS
ncbi:hypothetical protein PuT2_14990 [Pusillimonas sp. T2]|uniref:hypothetical protein n=1 Tax=Pusillimonas sp. T2 TaxID=1548123 RepID=UPI000B9CEB62|nr:hypothetical protein [Pusillimonas sp. T2]OXR48000.1 hypothetical protein PuT2_14990 [Pusillimonas sp. T2]